MKETITLEEWLAALRSGKYQQHHGALCNEERSEFCCLGVGVQLTTKRFTVKMSSVLGATLQLPDAPFLSDLPRGMWTQSQRNIDLEYGGKVRLASELNDGSDDGLREHTFTEIADAIEENARSRGWLPSSERPISGQITKETE